VTSSLGFVNVVLGNTVNGNCSFVFALVVPCESFFISANESYEGGASSKINGLC
jgi:hypothetical protein